MAQKAENWRLAESLFELLSSTEISPALLAQLLRAHKFPLALAQRPLASLSPGERLRAALIGLYERQAAPELLLLDEPTQHLDFVGVAALRTLLLAWPGGLILVSHDAELLAVLRLERELKLPAVAEPGQMGIVSKPVTAS